MSGSLISLVRDALKQKFSVFNDIRTYGAWSYIKKIYQLREAWWDKKDKFCVGTDQYGNTYWETKTPTEHVGRNRWVELPGKQNKIYDAANIPPEWHMWLHRIRDQPPTPEEIQGKGRAWKTKAWEGNTTGTTKRYYPPGHFFNPAHQNPSSVFGASDKEEKAEK